MPVSTACSTTLVVVLVLERTFMVVAVVQWYLYLPQFCCDSKTALKSKVYYST